MRRALAALTSAIVSIGGLGCESRNPASPWRPVLAITVYEHDAAGRRPVPNFAMIVVPEGTGGDPDATDASGRYDLYEARGTWTVTAFAEGYVQPCFASAATAPGVVLDVHVIKTSTLAQIGVPASFPTTPPTITGQVFEQTAHGARPLAGASVSAGGFTVTDRYGRYVLCNVRSGSRISVGRANTHFGTNMTLDLSKSTTYDFVLTPR